MSNTNTFNLLDKMGNKFYIPLKWSEIVDLNETYEYFMNLKLKQISIKDFKNLDIEDNSLLSDQDTLSIHEIIDTRIKSVICLINTCREFNLKNETLFKGISLFDYFLSKTTKKVREYEELNLIAVVCLNIACKF